MPPRNVVPSGRESATGPADGRAAPPTPSHGPDTPPEE